MKPNWLNLNFQQSILGYVTPHLVLLFLAPPIPALLVGIGVTTQAPSNNSNTDNKRNLKTQS
jgi:hypothetical protein